MLILHKNKDRPLRQGHLWIYSGAVQKMEGDDLILPVYAHDGSLLGMAMRGERGHSIAAHMIAPAGKTVEEALSSALQSAYLLRKSLFDLGKTNAFRLVNAEADQIPGLIVDLYHDTAVFQISHQGLESFRPFLIEEIAKISQAKNVIEKSTSFLRKKHGLAEVKQVHKGSYEKVKILEEGLTYAVDILEGQKTGFFLDQREMRSLVSSISRGKRVLNAFAYSGGFTMAALQGGAYHVTSLEISEKAGGWILDNLALNGFDPERHTLLAADAFAFFRKEELPYDLTILDPPALVKKRSDVPTAFRAYQEMNGHVMQKMPPNSLLLTASCSYHIDETLFQQILFRAALAAKRSVRIISSHRQAFDHPISIYHPETSYLKSFLLHLD